MPTNETLDLTLYAPLHVLGGGLFIAPPQWRHTRRCLDVFVLIFVRSGELHIQEDDTEFIVAPDQALLLFPGRTHWGTSERTENLTYFWMHFEVRQATAADPDAAPDTQPGDNHSPADYIPISLQQHSPVLRPERMETLFRLYLTEREKTTQSTLFDQQLGTIILTELLQTEVMKTEAATIVQADTLANRAAAYIHTNFAQPITTASIADALNCNPKSLSRAYHKLYGITLTEAIHRARIKYAMYCLIHQNSNVTEIAQASGFENVSYFIRIFRRHAGMTPAEYRRFFGRYWVNSV